MLGRAVFAILVIGLTAAVVLSLRQARLQAAHELTQARLRAVLLEEKLAESRAEVARATSPDEVRPAMSDAGEAFAADNDGEVTDDETGESRAVAVGSGP